MNPPTASILAVPVSSRDHIRGSTAAPVTLVQYGNYQCLQCGAAYRILKRIAAQFDEQLCFVFRHFPIVRFYPNAHHAAEAAEAAASQGRFWEMHDCLFTHQYALGNGYLVDYAALLNLNIPQFLREITSDMHVSRVRDDIRGGLRSGVQRTPAFFINGIRYQGKLSEESLRQALMQAL
ncbi:MAG: DsbA family protein [Leptolyngbyaceae bacterium]|nr:DsbA family protein [Leptolyngbyaceae bacterium]